MLRLQGKEYAKLVNIKKNIAAKHPGWTKVQVAIAAEKVYLGSNGTATPVGELNLFKGTESKLVEADLDTVEKVAKASDGDLMKAGLSEKAVAAVREIIAKRSETPAPEKAEETGLGTLKLFKATENRLVEAGIRTVEALKSATDEMLAKAGLSEKAVAAVRKMVA